jgi:hypothetical protein
MVGHTKAPKITKQAAATASAIKLERFLMPLLTACPHTHASHSAASLSPCSVTRLPLPYFCVMPTISKGLRQAYELQDFTFEAAISLRDSLPRKEGKLKIAREDAQSIAALVKSWESCQQRIAFHRRIPNPGSIKRAVERAKEKRRRWAEPRPILLERAPEPQLPQDGPTPAPVLREPTAAATTDAPLPSATPPPPPPAPAKAPLRPAYQGLPPGMVIDRKGQMRPRAS